MRYNDIKCFSKINEVDSKKVKMIAESIKNNGWIGCPILVYGEQLITGSHRLAALDLLYEDEFDIESIECAEDVTDIVENAMHTFEKENGYLPDIEFDNIGWIFKGTWVEEYKEEIKEW